MLPLSLFSSTKKFYLSRQLFLPSSSLLLPQDDDMGYVGEDEDTATLAAEAVAAAVEACDVTEYAASLQALKEATGSVE